MKTVFNKLAGYLRMAGLIPGKEVEYGAAREFSGRLEKIVSTQYKEYFLDSAKRTCRKYKIVPTCLRIYRPSYNKAGRVVLGWKLKGTQVSKHKFELLEVIVDQLEFTEN